MDAAARTPQQRSDLRPALLPRGSTGLSRRAQACPVLSHSACLRRRPARRAPHPSLCLSTFPQTLAHRSIHPAMRWSAKASPPLPCIHPSIRTAKCGLYA